MADQCCLNLNPDITGVGVRVALYVQILLGWFVSLQWPETFAKNARTAYMTAIALIIAAFIQLRTQNLSLLDGIVVSLITTMMITFAISSSPTRSNTQHQPAADDDSMSMDPNKSFSRFLTQFCFVAFWAAWCLLMWHDPVHFGLHKDQWGTCDVNSIVTLMVFGREIHATDPRMQRAALALVTIGIVIAFGSLWISLEGLLGPVIKAVRNLTPNPMTRDPDQVQKEEDSILKFIRRSLQVLSLGTLIYLIAATEKTIIRNDVTGSSKAWTYGQTIALILLLQQIMDVCSTFLEKRDEEKRNESYDKQSLPMTPLPVQPQTATMAMPVPQPATPPAASRGTTPP
ncbi:hypothetical protein FRC10_008011 [Ceratobasidium sp. 414]|nr:hypothetical protein FRC10_008011 [Ceratobasidium sp. 414]